MRLLKILLFATVLSLTLGELARFSIGQISGAFNLVDIFALTTFILWLLVSFLGKKKIYLPPGFFIIIIFWFTAFVSLVNALKFFPAGEVLAGSLFPLRFIIYSSIYLIVYNTISKKEIGFWVNTLVVTGVLVAVFGILQIIFVSDLSFLNAYGWDSHIRRLVSSFLDPNFVGGFLILTLILLLSKIIFEKKTNYINWGLAFILLVSIALTFSRSSYLMLLSSLFLIGVLKSRKIFLSLLVFLILVVVFVPKMRERIIGAVNIDVTAQARIESWQNALTITGDHLFLGVGFNTFRFAQADYGFFKYNLPEGGHSGAGSDSSLLTVLATCGVLGFTIFLIAFGEIILKSFARRKSFLGFCTFVSFVAIIIHSQFVNSLLFPLVMVWLWFLAGLAFARDKK